MTDTTNIDYSNNGYIINLYPHHTDSKESIENKDEWLAALDEKINKDINDRKTRQDYSNKDRYIYNEDVKNWLVEHVRRVMIMKNAKNQSQSLLILKELIVDNLFIVRAVNDSKCRYNPLDVRHSPNTRYQSDQNCEYWVRADIDNDREEQIWIRFNQIIKTLLIETHISISDDIAKQLLSVMNEDLAIPTVNFASHEDPTTITQTGFNISTHFSDGTYNHSKKEIRDSFPSDFVEIIGRRRYPLAKAINDNTNYEEYKELIDGYYSEIANFEKERALLLKQVHLTALLGYKPDMKAINLQGRRGTGKSSYIEIAKSLVGEENTGSASYEMMQDPNTLAELRGKTLIFSQDQDDKVSISKTGIIKNLLIGEDVAYIPKYQAQHKMNARNATILQAYNNAPKFVSRSDNTPLLDRMKLVVFENTFRHTDQEDKRKMMMMRDETFIPYIARYLLEEVPSFSEYAQSGDEQALKNQIDDNPLVDFVRELEQGGILNMPAIPVQDLYERYSEWFANENEGGKIISARGFVTPITELLSDYGYGRAKDEKYDRKTLTALDSTNYIDIKLYGALMRSLDLNKETANKKQVILYKKNYNYDDESEYDKIKNETFEQKDLFSYLMRLHLRKNIETQSHRAITTKELSIIESNDRRNISELIDEIKEED